MFEWNERFNVHAINVNGLFTIIIHWESDGYHIKYGSWQGGKVYSDLDDAKNAVLEKAYTKMKDALKEMEV